jgi:hypothetical protein
LTSEAATFIRRLVAERDGLQRAFALADNLKTQAQADRDDDRPRAALRSELHLAQMNARRLTAERDALAAQLASLRAASHDKWCASLMGGACDCKRFEAAMEKYAPEGFDPASDDMTVQLAMQLVEKDAEIARLQETEGLLREQADNLLAENLRLQDELNRQIAKTEYEAERAGNFENDLDAAKAEIERLKRELSYRVHDEADIKVQNDEIARLQDAKRRGLDLADERGKENNRLKASLVQANIRAGKYTAGCELCEGRERDNERLRALLKEHGIEDMPPLQDK